MVDPSKAEQERARAFGKSWHGSIYPDCSDERLCNFCMEIATALAHARSCALDEQRERDCRAICASCREGRPVYMDAGFGWWVHPNRSSGEPYVCCADAIRKEAARD